MNPTCSPLVKLLTSLLGALGTGSAQGGGAPNT